MTTLPKLLRLCFILLLGQIIPAFAGLDDRRHLPREHPYSLEQFKNALKLAEKGDAYAQYIVCSGYYAGKVIKKNYEKALSWCTLAAGQGLAQAQYWLGYFYFDGIVVERDYEKAVPWFELAAKQGYAAAQYSLAYMYEGGRAVSKNHEKALHWYQMAAKQEHPSAIKALARYHKFEENLIRAKQGDTSAYKDLFHECILGGTAHPECAQTLFWGASAALQATSVHKSNLAQLYLNGQVYKHGFKTEKNYEKALYWFQLAVKQSPEYSIPNYYLGTMYEEGIGVTKDLEQALAYYKVAARTGHFSAKKGIKRIRKQFSFFRRLKALFADE